MDSLRNIDWGSMAITVVSAILILIVTIVLALVAKSVVTNLVGRIPFVKRQGESGTKLAGSLGSILSLIIWLFGLIALLGVFGLDSVLTPVTGMLDTILAFLPNVIGAVFVLVVGLMIAKIAKTLIITALGTVDLSKLAGSTKSGLERATGTASEPNAWDAPPEAQQSAGGAPAAKKAGKDLPEILGTIVYALIAVFVVIAALQVLGIESISRPAEDMLATALAVVPNIVAAAVVLIVGVLIGRFVAKLLGQVLDGTGLDASLRKANVLGEGKSVVPTISMIVQIAIIVFFGVMAAQLLGFPQITSLLTTVLGIAGNIVLGAAVIAVGFLIAHLLSKVLPSTAGTVAKYAAIFLFVAMGLKTMGVGESIVDIAFGALVIGAALAGVLAFGLGGRHAAADVLDSWKKKGVAKSDGPSQRSI